MIDRKLLIDLPDPAEVWNRAKERYPARQDLAEVQARTEFEFLYCKCRYEIADAIEFQERIERLAGVPPHEDEEETHGIGGEGYVDPEAADIGRMPNRWTDSTRHDLRGIVR